MPRSLSLRYLLFTTLLIPIIRVFSPRAESATFLFATMVQMNDATFWQMSKPAKQPGLADLTCTTDKYDIMFRGVFHDPEVLSMKLFFVKGLQIYAPQTKSLDCRTNVWERIFEVLFKGVSTRFGLRSSEKYFENAFPNVRSDFQHLRFRATCNYEMWDS